jgi:hypothetical protein
MVIEYVEKIKIQDIKSSKYFNDLNIVLKNNIDLLIDNVYINNFKIENDNLYVIIDDDPLQIYKNNKLIKLVKLRFNKFENFTYQNNNIIKYRSCREIIKITNIDFIKWKKISINKDNNNYFGYLSVDAWNDKIYVLTYKEAKKNVLNHDIGINIYNGSGTLLKSSILLFTCCR